MVVCLLPFLYVSDSGQFLGRPLHIIWYGAAGDDGFEHQAVLSGAWCDVYRVWCGLVSHQSVSFLSYSLGERTIMIPDKVSLCQYFSDIILR